MTKYDMAVTMATVFGIPTDHIQADRTPSTGAKRPYNSQLDCSILEQMGISKKTKFAEEIKKVLSPFFPWNTVSWLLHSTEKEGIRMRKGIFIFILLQYVLYG